MTPCSKARRVGARQRLISLTLCASLTSALVAPAALAQEQQSQAENMAAARSLGLQGIRLADSGDCPGAIEKLTRAEALYHAPTILGRLGECQVKVGQLVLGTENLNRVVREPLAANAPKAFRDAQERAKGVLTAALPKIARLTVKVDPPGLSPQVTVGGVAIPDALIGAERPTDPGTYDVVATAPGYLEQKASVTLAEGGSQVISLKLEKDPNAVAATPATSPEPAPALVASTGAATPADTSPKKNHTLAYVSLGVGGAGLLVGGITGFLALGKKSDLKGCVDNRCPPSQKGTLDSASSLATVSTVSFAVGFVGVGVGVVLLLTGGSSGSASAATPRLALHHGAVTLEPFVSTHSAGVNGTF